MAVVFTGAGVASAASGASPQAVTTATAFAVGDYLVALISYDNSGGGGADPMTGTISVTPATGAVGASVSAQTGLNDPGTVSSGLAARCVTFPVTTAIPSGTSVNVTWTGTLVVRAVAFMKVSATALGGSLGYRGTVSTTGTNAVAATTVSHTTNPINIGEGVLCWAAHENGAAITGDADTLNGSWSAVYGTFTGSAQTGMAAYFQSKIVSGASAAQVFNPTGTSSDWIAGSIAFNETILPTVTQAAYGFYDDAGTESGAAALAAQNTPVTGNLLNGDGFGVLRVLIQSTNTSSVQGGTLFALQWEKNASGTWTTITTGGTTVQGYNNPNLTDGATTTSRLTGGTGAFRGSPLSETGTVTFGMNPTEYTELVYSVKLLAANFVKGDTLRFRVIKDGSTTNVTYSVTPLINILAPYNERDRSLDIAAIVTCTDVQRVTAITQAAYRFYADGTEAGSTALAAQDTSYTANLSVADINLGLRTRLQETSGAAPPATDDWQLQYDKNASGSWTNVASADVLFDSYMDINSSGIVWGATVTGAAQSFLGNGQKLSKVAFATRRTGTPPGICTARLYAHSATTFGVSGGPTGTALAISAPVAVTAFPLSPAASDWVYFTFDGTFTLVNGTPYFISYEMDTVGDGTNALSTRTNTTGTPAAGTSTTRNGSFVWSTGGTTADLAFQVFSQGAGVNAVTPYPSASLTDGAATTNRLGAGTGSFDAGKVSETGLVTDLGWSGNDYTELLYSLTLVKANLANSDSLTFRILRNGITTGLTYTATPTATVSIGGGSTNYNETGRSITIDAATTVPTERVGNKELALAISVAAATTTPVGKLGNKEPNLAITAVATTTVTDRAGRKELALSVSVAANNTLTDRAGNKELARAIAVVATCTLPTDQADFHETGSGAPVSPYLFTEDWNTADAPNWDFLKWPHQRPFPTIVGGKGYMATGGGPTQVYADTYVSDFEMTVKQTWPSSIGGQYPEIAWRMYSGMASSIGSGYLIQVNGSGNGIDLFKVGGYTSIAFASDASLFAAGTRWFKIRVVGHNHKVKWWDESSAEPGTWQIDVTDASPQVDTSGVPVTGGGIGFRYYGATQIWYDDLTVTNLGPDLGPDGSMRMLSNGKVNVNGSSNVFNIDTDLTWCCWFRVTSYAGGVGSPVISLFDNVGGYCITVVYPDGSLRQNMSSGGDFLVAATGTIAVNTWYFIAMSRTMAAGTDVYWAQQGTPTLTKVHGVGVGDVTSNPLRFLSDEFGGGPYTMGAAFKVWKAALSQAELTTEMSYYSAQRTANLFGSWPMKNGLSPYSENPVDNNLLLYYENGGIVSGPMVTSLLDAPVVPSGGAGLTFAVVSTITVTDAPGTGKVLAQEGFRWRNDDGSEITATWATAQDTNFTAAIGQAVRLRVLLDASGVNPDPAAYTLRYKKSTDSTWLRVPVDTFDVGSRPTLVGQALTSGGTEAAAGTAKTLTGMTWTPGDGIVIVVFTKDGTVAPSLPTNPNLTFTLAASAAPGGSADSSCYLYTALATSYQTNQTITISFGGTTTVRAGCYELTLSNVLGFANASSSQTEAAFSKTVSARSLCIYAHADFNVTAGKTGTTTSGSYSEQRDSGTTYRTYLGSWEGVSAGTYNFGVTDYTGSAVSAVFLEVLASANPVMVSSSANIAVGGEATTPQLAAPSGKTTANFSVGRMWADENGADIVTIT